MLLLSIALLLLFFVFFFFNATATTEIYTLSLHDALPISPPTHAACASRPSSGPRRSRCRDRKSTRLNSSHMSTSYAVFCLKKKKMIVQRAQPIIHVRIRRLCNVVRLCV